MGHHASHQYLASSGGGVGGSSSSNNNWQQSAAAVGAAGQPVQPNLLEARLLQHQQTAAHHHQSQQASRINNNVSLMAQPPQQTTGMFSLKALSCALCVDSWISETPENWYFSLSVLVFIITFLFTFFDLNWIRLEVFLYSKKLRFCFPFCTLTDTWSEIGNDLHFCCKYFTMIYFHGKSGLLRLFLVTSYTLKINYKGC